MRIIVCFMSGEGRERRPVRRCWGRHWTTWLSTTTTDFFTATFLRHGPVFYFIFSLTVSLSLYRCVIGSDRVTSWFVRWSLLFFCFTFQVACTNWKRMMMVLSGASSVRDPMQIAADASHRPAALRRLSNFSAPEAAHRLRTYTKVLFRFSSRLLGLSMGSNRHGFL